MEDVNKRQYKAWGSHVIDHLFVESISKYCPKCHITHYFFLTEKSEDGDTYVCRLTGHRLLVKMSIKE